MRIMGPESLEPPPPPPPPYVFHGMDVVLIRCMTYMIIAAKNITRMMQQSTYPAVVVVSDARFRMVITNTISAMMNKKMNSYMFDLRINRVYSFWAVKVSS